MDRRNFLKYAAVGTAVAGAALAGYEFDRLQNPLPRQPVTTITQTQTVVETTSITTTETVRLASIYGRLFFDYNGNGVQDGEESAVPDSKVQLKDNTGKVIAEAVTDSSGDYRLEDVPVGSYRSYVTPDKADRKFRYNWSSGTGCKAIEEGIFVDLDEDKEMVVGLGDGFVTEPFHSRKSYQLTNFVDVDPRIGKIRDWRGGKQTYDGHTGIDYDAKIGEPICSIAPGVVIQAEDVHPNEARSPNSLFKTKIAGNFILVDHQNGFISLYFHLSKINVKPTLFTLNSSNPDLQRVGRGEDIGFVGSTGNSTGPHLHIGIIKHIRIGWQFNDLYRDLFWRPDIDWENCDLCYSKQVSLFTEDNKPHLASKI